VLFARGFGKRISRGNQGWAILSLSLKGIRRGRRGTRGGEHPFPSGLGKRQEKRLAKSTLLFATFSSKEKVGEVKLRSGGGPDLWNYGKLMVNVATVMLDFAYGLL